MIIPVPVQIDSIAVSSLTLVTGFNKTSSKRIGIDNDLEDVFLEQFIYINIVFGILSAKSFHQVYASLRRDQFSSMFAKKIEDSVLCDKILEVAVTGYSNQVNNRILQYSFLLSGSKKGSGEYLRDNSHFGRQIADLIRFFQCPVID